MTTDPYATLGIGKDASAEDIKNAYRRKASEAHPDREGGSDEHMADVNRAYAVLADPERRAAYDRSGDVEVPKTLEDRVRDYVIGVLAKALQQEGNLLTTARNAIARELAELDQADRTVATRIAKLQGRRDRIRVKGDRPNFAHLLIDQALNELQRKTPDIEDARSIGKLALQALEEYECDEMVTVFGMGGMAFSIGTSTAG